MTHESNDQDSPQRDGLNDVVQRVNAARPQRELVVRPASTYVVRAQRWLMEGFLPFNALSLLGGREGLGKSTWAYTLAAQVTRGKVEGELHGQPANVFVVATEDDWETSVVPRLLAAGADMARVFNVGHVIETGRDEGSSMGVVSLPIDIERLATEMVEKEVRLLLVDPIISRLSSALDTHKDADVRRALEPLAQLAHSTGATVLGVIHLNKGASNDVVNAVMGSRAFSAVARSLVITIRHPDDDNLRLIGVAKTNVGSDSGLARVYRIEERAVGQDPQDRRAVYGTYALDLGFHTTSIRDAASGAPSVHGPSEGSKVAGAEAFLVGLISEHGGPIPRLRVMDANLALGENAFSESTLKRAADSLDVRKVPRGYPRTTTWGTPEPGWPSRVTQYVKPTRQPTRRVRIIRTKSS